MRRGFSRPPTGFSLVEVLVSLVLVALALVLAARLLLEAQRVSMHAARDAHRPVVSAALGQLRNDAQGAAFVLGGSALWTAAPLELGGGATGRVRYRLAGEILTREALAEDGSVAARRVLLREVTAWRWRLVADDLLDAEIAWRRSAPASLVLTAPRWARPPEVEPRRTLRFALRGGGRLRWW